MRNRYDIGIPAMGKISRHLNNKLIKVGVVCCSWAKTNLRNPTKKEVVTIPPANTKNRAEASQVPGGKSLAKVCASQKEAPVNATNVPRATGTFNEPLRSNPIPSKALETTANMGYATDGAVSP